MIAATMVLASTSFALAETSATPATNGTSVAQASPAPTATPNPFSYSGYVRSYYFTRQNASNNPGTQWDTGKSSASNALNQASWNNAFSLHADYNFTGGGWYVGGSYLYANPTGSCEPAALHAKGGACTAGGANSPAPPSTYPDDTLPGFGLSTFYEAYVAYKAYDFSGKVGDQLFNSPWANPSDSRLKPAAFQGADFGYTLSNGLTLEAADMIQFENRTASNFSSTTLLTSYPAGGGGQASNLYYPGGAGKTTNGFIYGKVGYVAPSSAPQQWSADGYFYGVSDLVNMYWADGKYTFSKVPFTPYVALQGGYEQNAGASYIGKVQSSDIGIQLGATVKQNFGSFLVTAGFDDVPGKTDTVDLPKGVTCGTNNQITAKAATLSYLLPLDAPQCSLNSNGTANIYYGGWASPYTDNYATDPFFTTSISQGMADRRSAGTSYKIAATFTSTNNRFVFFASDAWYNYFYGVTPVGANGSTTNEWNLDGTYYLGVRKNPKAPFKGLVLRDRYAQRFIPNGFYPTGATFVGGGLPLFKYNRAQLEYDF
jgi:hypothetical protein